MMVLILFFKPLQLSPSFTPTSVIRKMYATKEKSRDDPSSHSETKEEGAAHSQDGMRHQFVLKQTPKRDKMLILLIVDHCHKCFGVHLIGVPEC